VLSLWHSKTKPTGAHFTNGRSHYPSYLSRITYAGSNRCRIFQPLALAISSRQVFFSFPNGRNSFVVRLSVDVDVPLVRSVQRLAACFTCKSVTRIAHAPSASRRKRGHDSTRQHMHATHHTTQLTSSTETPRQHHWTWALVGPRLHAENLLQARMLVRRPDATNDPKHEGAACSCCQDSERRAPHTFDVHFDTSVESNSWMATPRLMRRLRTNRRCCLAYRRVTCFSKSTHSFKVCAPRATPTAVSAPRVDTKTVRLCLCWCAMIVHRPLTQPCPRSLLHPGKRQTP